LNPKHPASNPKSVLIVFGSFSKFSILLDEV